ncbi:MAG: rhomboid family intramembrane serine protease [Phycisphaerales bacterium]
MGISDRDYTRVKNDRWSSGGARGGGLGLLNPRSWTMTGWLVGLNVAVAVLGFVLLRLPGDKGWDAVPVSTAWREGVTEREKTNSAPVKVDKHTAMTKGAPVVKVPLTTPPQVLGTEVYSQMSLDQKWGHFSTLTAFGQLEVWRFITFQFLHQNWLHLVLNLVGLWTFGPDVEEYLGRKRYLALYLVCGVFGALAYLLLNLLGNLLPGVHLPALLIDDVRTPLVGASAGIFGIMLAAAFVVPQRVIDLFFVIPLRVKPAVYLFFGLSVISLLLGRQNAGGEAAHIGGAVAGYYFIRHMYHLRDFFDVFGGSKKPGAARINQSEIDRILAKIHQHGESSLDDDERAALKQATEAAKGSRPESRHERRPVAASGAV